MRRASTRAVLLALALALVLLATASGEVVQSGKLRVSFAGKISPKALPRKGVAPIAVTVGGKITTANRSDPPQLQKIEIAINRNGRLDYAGLPTCAVDQIQPATTANALAACGPSKVGEGTFSANVMIPQQSPFPSKGKIVVFNGRENGRPVLFAHVYGTDPVPTSYTLPMRITQTRGTFGTLLTASLPQVTSDVAFVTGISITLERRFQRGGVTHSYLSAGCPAPDGFPGAVFPFARATFDFGKKALTSTLTRSCKVRG